MKAFFKSVSFVCVALISLSGCASFVIDLPHEKQELKSKINFETPPEFFNVSRSPIEMEYGERKEGDGFYSVRFSFSSQEQPVDGKNNLVSGVIYYPERPLGSDVFVVLPGIGEYYSTKLISEKIARYGYTAIGLNSRFHFISLQDLKKETDATDVSIASENRAVFERFAHKAVSSFRQRTIDLMRLNDHIENTFSPRSINVVGISVGGILGSLLAGVDSRVNGLMMVVSSGRIARIVTDSEAATAVKIKGPREELLAKFGITKEEMFETLSQELLPVEPTEYSHRLDPSKILMVSGFLDMFGVVDTAIPFSATYETWQSFGKPKWITIFPGHASAFLAFLPFWVELPDPTRIPQSLFEESYIDHLLQNHFFPIVFSE